MSCTELEAFTELQAIIDTLPTNQKRDLKRIIKEKVSSWLSVLPTVKDGFDLSAQQFRDRLFERYGRESMGIPAECDGCGNAFSLQHALDCKKGGLVKKGLDSLRDECSRLAEAAWGGVRIEPIIKEACGRLEEDLRADFCVRGVWEGDRLAFFDNFIIDADAPSRIQRNTSYKTSLNAAERKV